MDIKPRNRMFWSQTLIGESLQSRHVKSRCSYKWETLLWNRKRIFHEKTFCKADRDKKKQKKKQAITFIAHFFSYKILSYNIKHNIIHLLFFNRTQLLLEYCYNVWSHSTALYIWQENLKNDCIVSCSGVSYLDIL